MDGVSIRIFAIAAFVVLAGAGTVCAEPAGDDAQGFTFQIDLRGVAADGLPSYLQGGGGKLRFDADHDGLRIGRVFLDYHGRLTDTLTAHATLNTYGDHDKNTVDVTEVYLDWRPFPA